MRIWPCGGSGWTEGVLGGEWMGEMEGGGGREGGLGRGWGRTGDGGWKGSGRVVGWNSTVQGVCTEGMTKGFGFGMVCYAGRELGGGW